VQVALQLLTRLVAELVMTLNLALLPLLKVAEVQELVTEVKMVLMVALVAAVLSLAHRVVLLHQAKAMLVVEILIPVAQCTELVAEAVLEQQAAMAHQQL
jgi:hypothetical protein